MITEVVFLTLSWTWWHHLFFWMSQTQKSALVWFLSAIAIHRGCLNFPPSSELGTIWPSFLIKSLFKHVSQSLRPEDGSYISIYSMKKQVLIGSGSQGWSSMENLGVQWERELGLITEVCWVVATDMVTLGQDFAWALASFPSGARKTPLSWAPSTSGLALTKDTLFLGAGWAFSHTAAIWEGRGWWCDISHIRSSRPFITGQAHLILSCIRKITLITTLQTEPVKIDRIRLWPGVFKATSQWGSSDSPLTGLTLNPFSAWWQG